MKAIWLALVFVVAFGVALAARAPAGLAARALETSAPGLTIAEARGTVWAGEAAGLSWNGRDLGEITFRTRAGGLISGRLVVDARLSGAIANGSGRLERGLIGAGRDLVARDIGVTLDAGAIDGLHPRVRARGGQARLQAQLIEVRSGACAQAQGAVSTDVLTRAGDPRDWIGPVLEGPVSCVDGAFSVAMAGVNPAADITVTGLVSPSGEADVTARVAGGEATLNAALTLLGFEREGDELVYARSARIGASGAVQGP